MQESLDKQHSDLSSQHIVKRWIESFNRHNVTTIVSLYTEDAELFDSGMKYPRRGRAEIERWFTKRFHDMPTIAYTPSAYLFTGNQAAVTWTVSGRSPRLLGQSWLSRPFRMEGVSVFTLHDGHIQKQHGYYDHFSALEQILPFLKVLPVRL